MRGDVGIERFVRPDLNAKSTCMCRCEILSRWIEGDVRTCRRQSERIDEVTRSEIEDTDDTIHRRRDDPAPVVRESDAIDRSDAPPELANDALRRDIMREEDQGPLDGSCI